MSYVTSITPATWSPQPQIILQPCDKDVNWCEDSPPPAQDITWEGPVKRSYSYVTSWRGKRDNGISREFDRFKYNLYGPVEYLACLQPAEYAKRYANLDYINEWAGGDYHWHAFINRPHERWTPYQPWAISDDNKIISESDLDYRDYLIANLYEKANEAAFNGATFFAELGESIVYVKQLLQSIIRMAKFTKGVIRRGANPEEAWLEWRYAVQPIMLTVEDVLTLLNEERRAREKVQAYKKYEPIVDTMSNSFLHDRGTYVVDQELTVTYKCGARLDVVSQDDRAPWGSSLHDMIMAGWEIVPASFIWDWFIDVGTWLGSFRDTDLVVGDRYATFVKEVVLKSWVNESASTSIVQMHEGPTKRDPIITKAVHINRIVGDEVSAPTLPCIVPGKLSLIHKLDALSLIVALVKGLRR